MQLRIQKASTIQTSSCLFNIIVLELTSTQIQISHLFDLNLNLTVF